MNPDIIKAMRQLIQDLGEQQALSEALDSIETALGPDSPNGYLVCDLRDKFREAAISKSVT